MVFRMIIVFRMLTRMTTMHGIPDIYHIHYIQGIYQDDQHDEVVEELLGDNPVDQLADTEREHNVKNYLSTQLDFNKKFFEQILR